MVWTERKKAELAKLWQEGRSIDEIAERLGCTRDAVAHCRKRMGLPVHPNWTARNVAQSKKLPRAGKVTLPPLASLS